jgi:hypothetical protein
MHKTPLPLTNCGKCPMPASYAQSCHPYLERVKDIIIHSYGTNLISHA